MSIFLVSTLASKAIILVCDENFHGRTTTIVSFSSDPTARAGFGPFTPGFHSVPYGKRCIHPLPFLQWI